MEVKNIVIHHSESPGGDVHFIKHLHVVINGWRDTGYHRIICNGKSHGQWPAGEDGEVQKGRSLDDDSFFEENEYGAHARGHNRDSVGICLIGNFETREPTEKQVHSLIVLCAQLCKQFSLDPMTAIIGHKDLNNTDCPGRYLYSILPVTRLCVKYRLMLGTKVTK